MNARSRRGAHTESRAARGFTLIEVLVALAIVAIGMGALLATLSSSADTVSYLRDKTFAEWVALNHIAELRLKGQIPAKGKTDGDVDFANGHWHWQQEVLDTSVKGIERIDVSVRPVDAPGNKDTTWYTTVTGIMGDAVSRPDGNNPPFDGPAPGGGQQPGPQTAPNNQPGVQPTIQPTVQPPLPPGVPTVPPSTLIQTP